MSLSYHHVLINPIQTSFTSGSLKKYFQKLNMKNLLICQPAGKNSWKWWTRSRNPCGVTLLIWFQLLEEQSEILLILNSLLNEESVFLTNHSEHIYDVLIIHFILITFLLVTFLFYSIKKDWEKRKILNFIQQVIFSITLFLS